MINTFLNSGFEFTKDEFELKLKYHFFNLLLLINIAAVTLAGFFRLSQAEYTQMSVDFFYVFISLVMTYTVRIDKKYFNFLVHSALLVAYFTVAMTFYIGASNFTGLGWYFILMLVVFFLTDKKFSLFMFALSTVSILFTIYIKVGILNLHSLPFGMIPFIIFTLFVTFYNQRNSIQQKLLKEQNELLKAHSFSLENYDFITKLPNRIYFNERLEEKIVTSKSTYGNFSILKIDLDDFKKINDTYGHSFGDEVLLEITKRLKAFLHTENNLSKMGIDEFIIINDFIETKRLIKLANKIQDIIKEEIILAKKTLYITSSIGIAIYNKDGDDVESLIKNVDSALHKAKKSSRDNVSFYHSSLGEILNDELTLLYELKNAIEKKEFEVYYQPQINALSGKMSGVEALVRWNSSAYKKIVSPDDFIAFAEEYGLIDDIDFFVMSSAMKDFCKWKKQYPNIGRLSLNLSIKVLDNKKYLENLKILIKETGCHPEWLELEILEGHIMKDTEVFIKTLEEINAMGIKVAIDDFGTGYSSLAYLQKLPVHKLKIDRSFMLDIPENIDGTNLVKFIINMSNTLNLDVLAEGVETESQKDFLLENGCQNIQGYLYSKPIASGKMYDYIQKNQDFQA